MRSARLQRLIPAWAAILAVLLMSIAPSVSHALRGSAAPTWVEVCTTSGAKWVDASGDAEGQAPAPSEAPAHLFEHCPYCGLHASDLGPMPASSVVVVVPAHFEFPPLFLSAPHTLHAWLAAQPRGPPALS